MPIPKKKIMGRGESSITGAARGVSRSGSSSKPVVKVKVKPNTKAEPKSNVKKVNNTLSGEDKAARNVGEGRWLKDIKSGRISREVSSYVDIKKGKKPTVKITGK